MPQDLSNQVFFYLLYCCGMEELIFQYLPIELHITEPFGLFKRGVDTVAVLVRDRQGQWVLGRKDYLYPEGIVRMIGGGMDDNNPVADAQRELKEELGIEMDEERLKPLVHAEITGHLPNNEDVTVSVFVFYAAVFESISAHDDLSGLAYLADRDMHRLVEKYAELPDDMINDEHNGLWSDYGKIWGPIHQAALARVKELGL
jgi:8-oxo-dGTP pyrophosphatase MutT (NUDIX family)